MGRGNSTLNSVAPLTMIFLAANIILYVVSSMQSKNFIQMDTTVLSNLGASQRERLYSC